MPILFSKVGDTIEDQILPYEFFNVQLFLDQPTYVKFNVTFTKNSNLGKLSLKALYSISI